MPLWSLLMGKCNEFNLHRSLDQFNPIALICNCSSLSEVLLNVLCPHYGVKPKEVFRIFICDDVILSWDIHNKDPIPSIASKSGPTVVTWKHDYIQKLPFFTSSFSRFYYSLKFLFYRISYYFESLEVFISTFFSYYQNY